MTNYYHQTPPTSILYVQSQSFKLLNCNWRGTFYFDLILKFSTFPQDFFVKRCLTLCSQRICYIPVLICASLYLIVNGHICLLHKTVSFLNTEALYRKLNLKTVYKGRGELPSLDSLKEKLLFICGI